MGDRREMSSRLPGLTSGHGPWLHPTPHSPQRAPRSFLPVSHLKVEPQTCCIYKLPSLAALSKWVQGPWAPQGMGWDQDGSPMNKNFSHASTLGSLRGTWTQAACFYTDLPERTNLAVFSQQQAKKIWSRHISYREGWQQTPRKQHPSLLDESPEMVTCQGRACAAHGTCWKPGFAKEPGQWFWHKLRHFSFPRAPAWEAGPDW